MGPFLCGLISHKCPMRVSCYSDNDSYCCKHWGQKEPPCSQSQKTEGTPSLHLLFCPGSPLSPLHSLFVSSILTLFAFHY